MIQMHQVEMEIRNSKMSTQWKKNKTKHQRILQAINEGRRTKE